MNPISATSSTKNGNNAGNAVLWAGGSIDATGKLVESLSYDPWGRRRKATDWTDYNISSTLFDRGFTGHEHLPQFGLINMNGRVYDPFLARFLSPDPFIQAPTYTQNYNRYSYAWNNPLKFFDPSGYINQYPDEGGIPTRQRDGGSSSATFAPSSMVNVWNGRGGFGPGSGRHWSDPYRSEWGNFMLGSRSSFIRIYGQNAHENYVSYYTGDNNRFVWNPIAGDEVYRESGKGFVNIYYSGGWVKASPFTGPAFGGGVPVYSNALIDGPGGSDGGGESSWASAIWNSTFVRAYTGDAIFVNTTFSLVFLGGGSNASGFVLPLRGPDAFKLNFINTATFRLGPQGGWDLSVGKMWFNGPAESAYVRDINGYGTSLDFNLGIALGWGPGAGVFESHNDAGKTTWFGAYGSFGYGIGGSLGFDYTYTTPVFGK